MATDRAKIFIHPLKVFNPTRYLPEKFGEGTSLVINDLTMQQIVLCYMVSVILFETPKIMETVV